MALCDKYTPFTFNGIIGNATAISKLQQFGADAQEGNVKKPLMVYGPTGIGKTVAVNALAYLNGFELVEFNASDYRNSEKLNKTLIPASMSSGLFSKRLLIVLDEIDELSKKYDSGAEKTLLKLIKSSKHPIIFIANDYWSQNISFLRFHVEKLEFKKPNTSEILEFLTSIAKKESKNVGSSLLETIANRCNGDVRAALNDLELMLDGTPELMENLGLRNRKKETYGVLDSIFLSKDFEAARRAAGSSDLDINMLSQWIEENIPNRYLSKRDLSRSFSRLARASFFLQKARRTNYYGYYRYASAIMSGGISIAPYGRVSMLKTYSFPSSIRYLSATKKDRSAIKTLVSKLIYKLHSDKRNVLDSYIPLLKIQAAKLAKEGGKALVLETFNRDLGLEKEEVEVLSA